MWCLVGVVFEFGVVGFQYVFDEKWYDFGQFDGCFFVVGEFCCVFVVYD